MNANVPLLAHVGYESFMLMSCAYDISLDGYTRFQKLHSVFLSKICLIFIACNTPKYLPYLFVCDLNFFPLKLDSFSIAFIPWY